MKAVIALIVSILFVEGLNMLKHKLRYGASCCGEKTPATERVRAADEDVSHYPFHYRLNVEGMTCTNCARRVENAFHQTGEAYAKVNLKEKQTAIVDGLEGDSRFIGRITSIGLTPGCEVKVIKNDKNRPVLVYSRDTMFAGALNGAEEVSLAAAFALTIGIALQNIPEGIFVSTPIRLGGEEKSKSFLMGVISGIIEPLLGIAMIILVTAFPGILLFLMALTGGAIAFLVIEENIPSMCTGEHSDKGTLSFAIFFCLMMAITFTTG